MQHVHVCVCGCAIVLPMWLKVLYPLLTPGTGATCAIRRLHPAERLVSDARPTAVLKCLKEIPPCRWSAGMVEATDAGRAVAVADSTSDEGRSGSNGIEAVGLAAPSQLNAPSANRHARRRQIRQDGAGRVGARSRGGRRNPTHSVQDCVRRRRFLRCWRRPKDGPLVPVLVR